MGRLSLGSTRLLLRSVLRDAIAQETVGAWRPKWSKIASYVQESGDFWLRRTVMRVSSARFPSSQLSNAAGWFHREPATAHFRRYLTISHAQEDTGTVCASRDGTQVSTTAALACGASAWSARRRKRIATSCPPARSPHAPQSARAAHRGSGRTHRRALESTEGHRNVLRAPPAATCRFATGS